MCSPDDTMGIRPVETLGMTLRSVDGAAAVVDIPIADNHNDKGTQFAGSLYAGAVFAGYRLVRARMRERGLAGTLVCRDAAIRYFRPLGTDATARGRVTRDFVQRPGGNLHIGVAVDIAGEDGATAARARFTYVVVKEGGPHDGKK